jgi:hypothetical protein
MFPFRTCAWVCKWIIFLRTDVWYCRYHCKQCCPSSSRRCPRSICLLYTCGFQVRLSWSNCQLGSRFLIPMFAEDVAAKWRPFEYGVWATMLNPELTWCLYLVSWEIM